MKGSSREVQGKSKGSSWEVHGKSMGSSWEVHGKFMGSYLLRGYIRPFNFRAKQKPPSPLGECEGEKNRFVPPQSPVGG